MQAPSSSCRSPPGPSTTAIRAAPAAGSSSASSDASASAQPRNAPSDGGSMAGGRLRPRRRRPRGAGGASPAPPRPVGRRGLAQDAVQLLVGGQRVGASAGAVEHAHEADPQALAQGMDAYEFTQAGGSSPRSGACPASAMSVPRSMFWSADSSSQRGAVPRSTGRSRRTRRGSRASARAPPGAAGTPRQVPGPRGSPPGPTRTGGGRRRRAGRRAGSRRWWCGRRRRPAPSAAGSPAPGSPCGCRRAAPRPTHRGGDASGSARAAPTSRASTASSVRRRELRVTGAPSTVTTNEVRAGAPTRRPCR